MYKLILQVFGKLNSEVFGSVMRLSNLLRYHICGVLPEIGSCTGSGKGRKCDIMRKTKVSQVLISSETMASWSPGILR